jgi:hypothetical protein
MLATMRVARRTPIVLLLLVLLAAPGAHAAPDEREASPPRLNIAALHRSWEQRFFPGQSCTWPVSRIEPAAEEPARDESTIAGAVAASARSESSCGPTIILSEGRFAEGRIELSEPTILVGTRRTILTTSFLNMTRYPLWVQRVTFESPPFPGALLSSDPEADVTVIAVDIRSPEGFGIVHNGGRLEAWNLRVQDADVATGQLPTDDGGNVGPGRTPRYRDRSALAQSMVEDFSAPERMGPGLKRLTRRILTEAVRFAPIDASILVPCAGTGLLLKGGAFAELHETSFVSNAAAGVVVRGAGTWANATSLGTAFNGLGVSVSNIEAALTSDGCFGGVDADDGLLLADGLSAALNAHVGVMVRREATAGLAAVSVVASADGGADWGDDILVFESFISLADFVLNSADRAGIAVISSIGNLVDGESSGNRFGLASTGQSALYLDGVDVFGNSQQDILDDGDLTVPNQPLPVPENP